jgi:hypothetical protein
VPTVETMPENAASDAAEAVVSVAANAPVEKPAAKSKRRGRKGKSRYSDDEMIDLATGELFDRPAW